MKNEIPKKDNDLFSMIDHQQEVMRTVKGINKLNAVIDWELFRGDLETLLGYDVHDARKGGRPRSDLRILEPQPCCWNAPFNLLVRRSKPLMSIDHEKPSLKRRLFMVGPTGLVMLRITSHRDHTSCAPSPHFRDATPVAKMLRSTCLFADSNLCRPCAHKKTPTS